MKKGYETIYIYWCQKCSMFISRNGNVVLMTLVFGSLAVFIYNYLACSNLLYILADKNLLKTFVLSVLGGLYTVVWASIKYKLSKDKMVKDLFKDFNERYTGEMNDLFEELRNAKSVEIAKCAKSLLRENNLIVDYFNLCSEEFYWYKKKRIPSFVWKNWENGIIENLKIEEVYKMLCKEDKRYKNGDTYYGFIKYIKIDYNYKKYLTN